MQDPKHMNRRDILGALCATGAAAVGAPLLRTVGARAAATGAVVAAGATVSSSAHAAAPPASSKQALTPDQALDRLIKGNEAFLADKGAPPLLDRKRRLEIAKSQTPFAILVGCADSRVPPEALFGQGLGDLFIIRVAGNTVSQQGLGSIEYAVHILGVPLVVVMGHERCGAVDAAVSVVREGTVFPGAIGDMVQPILPAAITTRNEKDWLDAAVRRNVVNVVEKLKISGKLVEDPIAKGRLKVVGARYDLDDGSVDFFHR